VAPLQEDAVTELHKLFQWVHRSRRGVLLFIDEADSFLASRKGANMSESLRNALTTMLYHTGTPTSQFMLVLATNRPNDLDAAALDRIDESVEFGLPALEARESMVQLYFQKYIAQPLGLSLTDSIPIKPGKGNFCRGRQPRVHQPPDPESLVGTDALKEVARRIHGFSGREISKLFTSLQTHILYSERGHVDSLKYMPRDQLFEVVKQKVVEHARTHEFQSSGYDYVHNEEPAEATDTDPKIMPELRCRPKPLNEETLSGLSEQRAPVHHQLSPTATVDTSGNSPLRVFGFASTPTDA
jgi:ATPase family AAA domain-containing protein 3A/B